MTTTPGSLARILDMTLVFAGAQTASQIRLGTFVHDPSVAVLVAFSLACTLTLFPAFGVYQSARGRSMRTVVGRIALAWFAVQVCGLVLIFSLHASGAVSRLWFFYWSVLTSGALCLSRLAVGIVLARVRHAGHNLHRVAVVGSGEHGSEVVRRIDASTASGFRAVSLFDPSPGAKDQAPSPGLSIFTDFHEFADHLRSTSVRELWLALPVSQEATIVRCLNEFHDDLLNIRLIPDMSGLEILNGGMVDLIGVPAINLVASPLSPRALIQKEIFDRVFAAIAIIALAPLLMLIAVTVKLSSPGPVLFTQMRKGADARVFRIYKFRTMRAHGEAAGQLRQATRNDSRITKVGAFLRRTSLDELPQFFNVLRGEMSIVGPRPHALEHDDLYGPIVNGYRHRYRMKPGITGWAQVNGLRGETDRIEKMQRRVEYDIYYLRNWSFGLDLRIIGATVVKGFIHPNAY
jgi:Undecaprenyl-phosphate glucose phosphotransferase